MTQDKVDIINEMKEVEVHRKLGAKILAEEWKEVKSLLNAHFHSLLEVILIFIMLDNATLMTSKGLLG